MHDRKHFTWIRILESRITDSTIKQHPKDAVKAAINGTMITGAAGTLGGYLFSFLRMDIYWANLDSLCYSEYVNQT